MKWLGLLVLPFFLLGCEGDTKVGDPVIEPNGEEPVEEEEFKGVEFDVPKGWTAEKPSNMLRKAQYQVTDKDGTAGPATMVFFGEMGGTVEENISRWQGSVAPDDQGQSPEETRSFDGSEFKATLVDLQGTYHMPSGKTLQDYRVVNALVETPGGNYIFKLYGPRNSVADWTGEFDALLKSVRAKK